MAIGLAAFAGAILLGGIAIQCRRRIEGSLYERAVEYEDPSKSLWDAIAIVQMLLSTSLLVWAVLHWTWWHAVLIWVGTIIVAGLSSAYFVTAAKGYLLNSERALHLVSIAAAVVVWV